MSGPTIYQAQRDVTHAQETVRNKRTITDGFDLGLGTWSLLAILLSKVLSAGEGQTSLQATIAI